MLYKGGMKPDLVVRPAKSGEKDVLEHLQRRASLAWDDYQKALVENPDAIDLPQEQIDAGHVLVCEKDGAVAGFAVVLPCDDGGAELDGLFVEPQIWRSGIGRTLLRAATAVALQRGAKTLHVIANPRALDFYQTCGFTSVETMETRFGPAVGMTLVLIA